MRITRTKIREIVTEEVLRALGADSDDQGEDVEELKTSPETEATLRYELSKAKIEITRLKRSIEALRLKKDDGIDMEKCLQFVSKVVDSSKGKTTKDKTK